MKTTEEIGKEIFKETLSGFEKWFSKEEINEKISNTISYIKQKIPRNETEKLVFKEQVEVLNFIVKELFGGV